MPTLEELKKAMTPPEEPLQTPRFGPIAVVVAALTAWATLLYLWS